MARILPIVSVVLLVAVIISGVLLWWPQLQEFLDLREELSAKESQLQDKREYFSQLEKYSNILGGYKEELRKIDYALPERVSPPAIFSFFQQLCAVNGLVLEDISAESATRGGKASGSIQEFGFSATIRGSYDKFKDFLGLLYKNSRMIDVKKITFDSPSEGSIFKIALNLKTHYISLETLGEGSGTSFPSGR